MSKKSFPAWRYHKDFAPCIFETEEDIQIAEKAGWVDSPAKVNVDTETNSENEGEDENTNEDVSNDEADAKSEEVLAETMEIEIPEDLSELTVPQLRQLCKDRGLTHYSKLREKELVALLEG